MGKLNKDTLLAIGVTLVILAFPQFSFVTAFSPSFFFLGVSYILQATSYQPEGDGGEGLASAARIRGRGLNIRNPVAPWRVIYGHQRVGGVVVFIHLTGISRNSLHIVMILAGHEVEAIDTLYLNGKPVPLDGNGFAFAPPTLLDNVFLPADVNVADNHITKTANGLLENMRIRMTSNGTLPAGLVVDRDYYVRRIDANDYRLSKTFNGPVIDITDTGTVPNDTFVPANVNIAIDSITMTGHPFTAGDTIIITNDLNDPPEPLTENTNFFVLFIDANIIKLSTTAGGSPIDLTDIGTGVNTITAHHSSNVPLNMRDFTGKVLVEKALGSPTQVALPGLVTNIGDANLWGSNHRLQGRAYVYVRLQWDNELFSSGMPTITFDVKGKKIFDPVTDTTIFSNNAAMVAVDYLTDPNFGPGVPIADVNDVLFVAARNICNESVSLADGTSESRYLADGVIVANRTHRSVMRELLSAMGGKMTYVGGNFNFYAAAYRAPTVSLAEIDFVGPMEIQNLIPRRENFNSVKGVYVSPNSDWKATDYPPYNRTIDQTFAPGDVNIGTDRIAITAHGYSDGDAIEFTSTGTLPSPLTVDTRFFIINKTDDDFQISTTRGGSALDITSQGSGTHTATTDPYLNLDEVNRVYQEVSFPFTISSSMAQRLAKILLEEARQSITVQVPGKLTAFENVPPDVVNVSNSRMGWTNKPFELMKGSIVVNRDQGIGYDMVWRETAPDVYDWFSADEKQIDLAPNTDLPNPFINDAVPANLALASGTVQLFLRLDGTIFSRIKVSWTAPDDIYVINGGIFEIQFKKSADSTFLAAGITDGSVAEFFILDVEDGQNYDVRVRSVNSLQVKSAFATVTAHTVIGKTAPPANVTGLAGTVVRGGIRLTWNAVTDLDLKEYIIRQGTVWVSGSAVATRKALEFFDENVELGANDYMIKAVDTTGNESTTEDPETITYVASLAPTSFAGAIVRGGIRLTWTGATDVNADLAEIRTGTVWSSGTPIMKRRAGEFFHETVLLGNNNFMIKTIDVFGFESAAEATLLVVYPAPPNVVNFFVVQNAGTVLLGWKDVVFINLHGYTLRYRKRTGTGGWDSGIEITDVDRGTSHTTISVPPGDWTFMCKAVDVFGFESTTEATADAVVQNINAVITDDEHANDAGTPPQWQHTAVNFITDHWTGRMPIDDQTAAVGDNFNVFDDYIDNPFAESSYTTQEYVLAITADVRLYAEIEADLHPIEITTADFASLEVSVDPDGSGFDPFEPFTAGIRTVKKVKFRMVFDNTTGEGVGIGFRTLIDQPPREERAKDVVIAVGGTQITFATEYLETPVVKITVEQPPADQVFGGYKNKTSTGFKIFIFNNNGTDVGGVADWEASNI